MSNITFLLFATSSTQNDKCRTYLVLGNKIYSCYENLFHQLFHLGYLPTKPHELCSVTEDVDGRNGCNSDEECLENARAFCDSDPACFGFSWFREPNRVAQRLKKCKGRSTSSKWDGYDKEWRTILKLQGKCLN